MPADNPTCFEDGSLCSFTDAPFDALLVPFTSIFGGWTYAILYGLILGIIWLRTQNTMMVGVIGIMMASLGITGGVIADFNEEWITIGAGLLAIAIGVVVYQIFHKLQVPNQ